MFLNLKKIIFEKTRCLCDMFIGTVLLYQPQELQLCFSLIEEKIVLKIYLHPSSGRLEPSWGVSQRACFGVTDW